MNRLFLAFVGMLALAFLIPFLQRTVWRRYPAVRTSTTIPPPQLKWLYYLGVGMLIATPLASGLVISLLKIQPLRGYMYLFMGMGVLLALVLPWLVAKLLGMNQAGEYWQFVSSKTGVNTKAIVWTWLGTGLIAMALGSALLFGVR